MVCREIDNTINYAILHTQALRPLLINHLKNTNLLGLVGQGSYSNVKIRSTKVWILTATLPSTSAKSLP